MQGYSTISCETNFMLIYTIEAFCNIYTLMWVPVGFSSKQIASNGSLSLHLKWLSGEIQSDFQSEVKYIFYLLGSKRFAQIFLFVYWFMD